MVMVVISCAVRFWQEYRSALAMFKLQASISTSFKVRRPTIRDEVLDKHPAPTEAEVSANDLVSGDVVLLSPGAVVPADCLVLESSFLRIGQSTWTGESEPAAKMPIQDGRKDDSPIFDQANIIFMGTSVVSGSGAALVLRTGDGTLNTCIQVKR